MIKFFNEKLVGFNSIDCNGNQYFLNRNFLLREKYKLDFICENKVVEQITNIQPLYLYPLTIIDYAKAMVNTGFDAYNPLMINIIKINLKLDYFLYLKKFKRLKLIEILIKSNYSKNYFKKVFDIINYCEDNNIMVTINFEDLCVVNDKILSKLSSKNIVFYKIFLKNIIGGMKFDIFLNRIKLLKNDATKLVKAYLNLEQVNYYEIALNKFCDLGIDIFQVSKELIPLNTKNINVELDVQKKVRNLENKYSGKDKTKFISVKDISILYYPRFVLDERNSRNCFASKLKPYLYDEYLLPCKVNKVINNCDDWCLEKCGGNMNFGVFDKLGTSCDDCASMFENDTLDFIYKFTINKNIEYLFEVIND